MEHFDLIIKIPPQHVIENKWESPLRVFKRWFRALCGYLAIGKELTRPQGVVREKYARIYHSNNDDWVDARLSARLETTYRDKIIITNGWFFKDIYAQILSQIFKKYGSRKILEVGSGRGQNVAALAIDNPDLELTGLELAKEGTSRSKELIKDLPKKIWPTDGLSEKIGLHTTFVNGSAFSMPFKDNSFDATYTVLALEQMVYDYPKALAEMRRVATEYCVFIEPFGEANGFVGKNYLKNKDYFRGSYKDFKKFGLQPIAFIIDYPHKVKYQTGVLIAKVLKIK